MTEVSAAETGEAEASPGAKIGLAVGLSTGAATMFLLLRLLAVSDWNWNTAAAVADTFDFSDVVPIVFGTLFSEPAATGALIAVLLPIAVLRLVWPIAKDRKEGRLGRIVLAAALVGCTVAWGNTYRSWWVFVGVCAIGAALVAVRLIWRRGAVNRAVIRVLGSVGAFSVIAALLLAVIVDTPWMSREEIVLPDGPIEGYVLQVESGFVKILTEDREVEILLTGDISSRRLLDE